MWMCSLCRLPVAKNHNFGHILTFGGSRTDPRLPMRVKFGVLEQIQALHLHAKFHLNVFNVSASGVQKPQFWANFDFWGVLYRPPSTAEGPIWCAIADPRYTLTCQISSRSIYSVALCWWKPPFLPFFGLRHLVVSPIGSSLKKLNTGAQPRTFAYPTVSKSFLYPNAFMAKSGAQSLTFKSVTDRQTDKQTKNSTFLAAPAVGEIRAPPNLARW